MRAIIDLVEAPERYHDVVQPGSYSYGWNTIYIEKPLTVYHATHKGVGLVLTDRVATSYNSMGTWLSSNKDMAQMMYGPEVASYHLPIGRYIMARRGQDMHGQILNCLPMIERNVDPDVADHLAKYPYDAKNLKWMKDVRAKARAYAAERGEAIPYGSDLHDLVDWVLRSSEPAGSVTRWRNLQATANMYAKVARSGAYAQEFKQFMTGQDIKGFIWNGRNWDNSPERQTIFLVLEHEPLHPIEQFGSDAVNDDVSFVRGFKSATD